jgi:hypothetical protein
MKDREARADDRKGFGVGMSRRMAIAVAAFVLVLGGVAAFGWLHVRSQQPVVMFTPEASAPEGDSGKMADASASHVAKEGTSRDAPESAKIPPTAPGFAPNPGEVLEFSASVAKVNDVASLRLRVGDKTELRGTQAWHLQAFAHTKNPLRLVFELDDQFDSYSVPGTYASLQYEMHLSERGQKVNSVQHLSATGKEPAPAGASVARVLPGTRDPLGLMQYLRSVDWSSTREVRSPVFDGRKLYEVRAGKTGTADVSVPAGTYAANAIEIQVYDNGTEMKDAHFTLYVTKDDRRIPVLLEAVMPFAAVRVELTKRSD